MVNAQEWINENYPKNNTCIREKEAIGINNYGKFRNRITELDISQKNISGELDLSDFENLEDLDCSRNQLTNLILPSKIKKICVAENFFTTFKYTEINLNSLIICDNKSLKIDLSNFSHLVNLEEMNISNTQIKGSLKELKNMTKLEHLDISDTDINKGVEYLPISIKYLSCSTEERPNSQLTQITPELENFMQDYNSSIKKEIRENEKLLIIFSIIKQKDIKSEKVRTVVDDVLIFGLEEKNNNNRRWLTREENYQTQIEIPPK